MQRKKPRESKKKLPKHVASSSSTTKEKEKENQGKDSETPKNEAEYMKILEEFEQHIRSEHPGAPEKKGLVTDSSSSESDMPGIAS